MLYFNWWKICVFIMLVLYIYSYKKMLINECARKKFQVPEFFVIWKRTYVLNNKGTRWNPMLQDNYQF